MSLSHSIKIVIGLCLLSVACTSPTVTADAPAPVVIEATPVPVEPLPNPMVDSGTVETTSEVDAGPTCPVVAPSDDDCTIVSLTCSSVESNGKSTMRVACKSTKGWPTGLDEGKRLGCTTDADGTFCCDPGNIPTVFGPSGCVRDRQSDCSVCHSDRAFKCAPDSDVDNLYFTSGACAKIPNGDGTFTACCNHD